MNKIIKCYICVLGLMFLFVFVSNAWADAKVMKCVTPIHTGIVKLKNKKMYYREGDWKPMKGRYSDSSWIKIGYPKVSGWDKQTWIWDFKYLTYTLKNEVSNMDYIHIITKNDGIYNCTKIE